MLRGTMLEQSLQLGQMHQALPCKHPQRRAAVTLLMLPGVM